MGFAASHSCAPPKFRNRPLFVWGLEKIDSPPPNRWPELHAIGPLARDNTYGPGRVAHGVPGEYRHNSRFSSITGPHRGPPTKEDHHGTQLQRGYQGGPPAHGPGRVRMKFNTQRAIIFLFFLIYRALQGPAH